MFVFFFLAISITCMLLNIFLSKKEKSPKMIVELVLLYLLVVNVGLGGLFAFFGHAFLADEVARSIGWPTGSPFQFEVAIANLALGTLGILCFWFRKNFWLAVGLNSAIFGFGAAFGHIRDMIVQGNYAINNVGPVLVVGDILLPGTLLLLLFVYIRNKAKTI